jgi:hypothetical protein
VSTYARAADTLPPWPYILQAFGFVADNWIIPLNRNAVGIMTSALLRFKSSPLRPAAFLLAWRTGPQDKGGQPELNSCAQLLSPVIRNRTKDNQDVCR